MGYYKEAVQCAFTLINSFQTYAVDIDYETYMNILEIWYLANAKVSDNVGFIAADIVSKCEMNPLLKKEYMKKMDYYDSVFGISSHFCE
jgi:hypothetical protein